MLALEKTMHHANVYRRLRMWHPCGIYPVVANMPATQLYHISIAYRSRLRTHLGRQQVTAQHTFHFYRLEHNIWVHHLHILLPLTPSTTWHENICHHLLSIETNELYINIRSPAGKQFYSYLKWKWFKKLPMHNIMCQLQPLENLKTIAPNISLARSSRFRNSTASEVPAPPPCCAWKGKLGQSNGTSLPSGIT